MNRTRKRSSGSQMEARPEIWDQLPASWRHAICLALLAAVSLSFFAPIHFGGKEIIGSDTVNWRATAESVVSYERETGEFALWATNVFAGMPAYMISYRTAVPQIDTLVSLLRQVFWPSSHLIVLLFGMYLLVFFLTKSNWAGVLAAVAFGLTTYIPVILVAGHNSKFITLCYAPWLLLGFAFALRRPGLLSSLLFAVALSINLRAGHVQIAYYTLIVMLVWWLGEGVSSVHSKSLKRFVASTLALLSGGVLAAMMVAQPYLAHYEYKAFTIRGSAPGEGGGGLAWDYAMGWSQGVGELLTLVVADAFGGSEAYWGEKPFTGGPHYVTALVAILAVVGVVRHRSVVAGSLGVSAVLLILFSLGSNLALVNRPMFDIFPLFSAFRVPETWLAVFALVAAVLAGLGLKSVVDDPPGVPLFRSFVALGFAAFVAVLLVLVFAGSDFLDFEKEGEYDRIVQQVAGANDVSPNDPRVARAANEFLNEMKAERRERFVGDVWRSIIMLLLASAAFLLHRGGRLSAYLFQFIVVLLVLIDLWGVDRRYLDESRLVQSAPVESAIPEYAFDRYILDRKQQTDQPFRVLSLEGNPTTTARPSYFYESLSGYHGAKLRLYQTFLDEMLITSDGRLNVRALRLMNTRYVVSRGDVPRATRVFTDDQTGFGVYELADYLPRAFFVDSLIAVQSSEEAFELLESEELDLSRVGVVHEEVDVAPARRDSLHRPEAVIASYSPRRIEIDAATDQERLLVVSEVYYPAGWDATVDGEPAQIHRVDYLLRGVVIPPGEHRVVLEFDPASHRVGLWVSAVSTALVYGTILVILGLGLVRSRQSGASEQSE